MPRRSLGLALFVCVLALALASCVSSEELRQEEEATCTGYGFHRGTDASLVVSRRKAWPGVTGLLRQPRIGVGAPGVGADRGGRIGLSGEI